MDGHVPARALNCKTGAAVDVVAAHSYLSLTSMPPRAANAVPFACWVLPPPTMVHEDELVSRAAVFSVSRNQIILRFARLRINVVGGVQLVIVFPKADRA